MKLIPLSILAAAAATGLASAQTTAYTSPVGYVSLGDTTPGQPAVKANTDVWISIPLAKPAVYAGTISVVSGNQVTLTGTPNLGNLISVPHTLTITSGIGVGIIALITSNTTNSVTVSVAPGDSLSGVASPDSVKISPAWTVLGFGGNTLPTGTTLYTYPTSASLNPAADGVYEWSGTDWIDNVNTGEPANNDVLYPGETLVLRNPTNTPVTSLIITGEVPTANSRIVVAANGPAGADNPISFFSPVGEPIGTSGLAAFAQNGDTIYGYDNGLPGVNKAANSVHEFFNGDWVDQVNTGEPDNTFPVGAGQGFILRRPGTSAQAIWNNQQDYLSLP
jgi:hypothetical protein